MVRVLDRIAELIETHRMFPPGARAGVAVSGGADSVCLLHVLIELGERWKLSMSIIHVNHLLRGSDSDADEQFVRELAAKLRLPSVVERIDVAALAGGGNLEQAAREARRAVFLREIKAGRVDRVALAHTRSDQAETVLFRFLRGSYATGLAGMRPVTPGGLVRPLLETDRAAVIDYLEQRGIAWREDRSNQDRRFARNRIRHDLLPALASDWNPGLPRLLAHHAVLAQEDESYWETEMDRIVPGLLSDSRFGVIGNAARVAELPNALARRVIRRAFLRVKGDLREIDYDHIRQALALLRRPSGHFRLQVPGVDILRSFDLVRFATPAAGSVPRDFEMPLGVPGTVAEPHIGPLLSLELIERQAAIGFVTEPMHGTLKTDLDWKRIQAALGYGESSRAERLVLRNWRPGDAYQRVGDQHEHKLKALFHESRIPLWERRGWPVITAAGRIAWSREFGPAADMAPDPDTRMVLRITENARVLPESHGALFTSL
jgi:tRNA(Ile)-lysidine synthase